MNHQPYENWLLDNSVLTQKEKETFESHLQNCPQCANLADSLNVIEREIKTLPVVQAPPDFVNHWKESLASRRALQKQKQTRLILISLSATVVVAGSVLAILLLPPISPITFIAQLFAFTVRLVKTISDFWSFVASFLKAIPAGLSIGIVFTITIWVSLTLLAWGISLYRITLKGIRTAK